MAETWQIVLGLAPLQTAAAMFVLGLVFGSFGYATFLRLAAGESLWGPRSQCPHCAHTLGAMELIPVLSFLCLGGRCRACRSRISVTYPLAEIGLGLAGVAGGYVHGWTGGAIGICLGLLAAVAGGLWSRRRAIPKGSPGVALLENLVAIGLITAMFAPVLNSMVSARVTVDFAQERMIMNGLARQRLNQLESAGRLSATAPTAGEKAYDGDYTIETVELAAVPASGQPWAGELYQVTVLVTRTCPSGTCTDRFGGSPPQVRMTSYVWVK